MTGLVLLLALVAQSAHAEPVEVHADQVEVKDGVATARGHVVIEMGDQRGEALSGTLEIATGALHLDAGTWYRTEGAMTFRTADIDLGDMSGVAVGARFIDGRRVLEAERVTLDPDGTARGEDVSYTSCECPNPTWEITARKVRVRLDETAVFTGGMVHVCGVPILPLPGGRLALVDRKSGFLFPRLGLGEDGILVAQPLYLVLGPSADTTLTPELRTERGIRGLGEVRYALAPDEGGIASGFLGRDTSLDAWRGAVGFEHGWAPGVLRTGVRGEWVTDEDVLADYSDSYLKRSTPWTEIQGTVGVGPVRAETDTFQAGGATVMRPVGGVVSFPALPLGPLVAGAGARIDAFATGEGIDALEAGTLRGEAVGSLRGGREIGPLRVEGAGTATATAWEDGEPWETGVLDATVMMTGWRDHGPLRHLVELGVMGALGEVWGAPDLRVQGEAVPPATVLGPVVDSTWLSGGGVPIHLRAAVPWIDGTAEPQGTLRVALGGWWSSLTANERFQEGDVSYGDGIGRAQVGLARADALLQARGALERDVPGASWLRLGYAGLVDLEDLGPLWHGPTLRYRSPCQCLEAGLGASWAEDKDRPTVRLQLEIL